MVGEITELLLPDVEHWRSWLLENQATSSGVWLVLHKKGGAVTELSYAQALDEALCFGWIDGQSKSRDAESSYRRWTPRGAKSIWSVRNTEIVERLEREGRMQPAGRAAVDAAKADGRWGQAYARSTEAELPQDLLIAIAANPAAQEMFEVLNAKNRFSLYFRLSQLKTEAARQRKIAGFVEMLARHEAPHPQRAAPQGD